MIAGTRIIEDSNLVVWVEDWSRVRSPGRALRRKRQGHRQNIVMRRQPDPKIITFGSSLIMHPEIARQLREKVDAMDVVDGRRQLFLSV
jgi:hypothetical protein